jgi:hypothetical protein
MRTATACFAAVVVALINVPVAAARPHRAAGSTEVVRAITENTGVQMIVGNDLVSVTSRFLDPRTREVIGRNVGFCVSAPSGEQLCTTTVFLPRGQLVLTGVYSAASRVVIPITGGTGHYADAGGFADIRPRGPMGSSVTFTIITHR